MVRSVSWALPALGASVGAVAAAALSGLGHRWGWWDFRAGFVVLRWAAYLGALAGGLSLAAAVRAFAGGGRGALALACAGVLFGWGLVGWTGNLLRVASSVPAIHDITTDTEHPPEFSAIVPLRAGAANPLAYGGAELAAQQRRAYPDIAPLALAAPPTEAIRRAAAAARHLGWTVVAEDAAAGRLEAYDRTPWYGFVDDVVVRITPEGAGSRVDVRSVSRVGRSDLGTNARRIRRFLRAIAGG